jgi:outer membrane protein TolC
MKKFRRAIAGLLCVMVSGAWAQQVSIAPVRPSGNVFRRPYEPVTVPPARLANSGTLGGLIRGGILYLTAKDAVRLAIENNVDIESVRYNEPLLAWRLERSEAGGALPGVPSNAAQASSNAAGQGVLGSQQAAGLQTGNNAGARSNANTTITQIGPVTQTLDGIVQGSVTLSHRSLPQANSTGSVPVIVQGQRVYTSSYQQGFVAGGSVTVSYRDNYLNENAPTDVLNPSVAPALSISFQMNLAQGFGAKVGGRNITIAKINFQMSDLTFRNQVARVVGNVLSTYYGLVGDTEDLKAKQTTLDTAARFLTENERRLELGSVAPLDVTSARSSLATARQSLVNAQLAVEQREVQLKNMISRNGIGDPALAAARIMPLDRIEIPAADDLAPLSELAAMAAKNRPDLLNEESNIRTAEIGELGTRNGLLPTVQAFGNRTTAGLAGTPRVAPGGLTADPRFAGGIGTALAQVFAQDFPTDSIGIASRVLFGNRQAQSDFTIDELSLRQQQLAHTRNLNQAQVDVANAVVALRQARSRYDAASRNRVLQEKLYEAEQKKLAAGESTTFNVTQQARDLDNARSSELSALVSYENARINIDQTTGTILEKNEISIGDAKTGPK